MTHVLHYHGDHTCSCRMSTQMQSGWASFMGVVRNVTDRVHERIERNRQLRALHNLDDRLLDDIGVSRDEAMRETAKLFLQTYARRHLK